MNFSKAPLGLIAASVYIVACIVLTATQGLFGESFIALILGLPWSMALAFFEYGNSSGALLYVLILAPMVLNAVVLYVVGSRLQRLIR